MAVTDMCVSRSLGFSEACVPSRSASRVLAPVTVSVAAWTDEEAWVRAAPASWRSWREKREAGQGGLQETLEDGKNNFRSLPSPPLHSPPTPPQVPASKDRSPPA